MKRATAGQIRQASPLVRALREAQAKFGTPQTSDELDDIVLWVKKRMDELAHEKATFDPKKAAANDD